MTSFFELELTRALQRNVEAAGYETPTPIQAGAIPPLLAGHDLLGCAQTGTGKTAAFTLPLLQHLITRSRGGRRACRGLILTPTRELAGQIADNLAIYGRGLGVKHTLIYGGVGYGGQINALARGVDIVVATPGRLLDLINQGRVRLSEVEVLVLDEADRMLDMGFIHDLRKIMGYLPTNRQTVFFSATMAGQARLLADEILTDPVVIEVAPAATPIELVEQQLMMVEAGNKRALLSHLLEDEAVERALVFTRTKHGADRLAKQLVNSGLTADAIHGNKSQRARQQALDAFRRGSLQVLVATEVAARGLDIEGVTHVFNFDLPTEPESYVHRIGRTGRAGASGIAVSFCSPDERSKLREIEQLIRERIPVNDAHPYHAAHEAPRPPRGRGGRYRSPQRRYA